MVFTSCGIICACYGCYYGGALWLLPNQPGVETVAGCCGVLWHLLWMLRDGEGCCGIAYASAVVVFVTSCIDWMPGDAVECFATLMVDSTDAVNCQVLRNVALAIE